MDRRKLCSEQLNSTYPSAMQNPMMMMGEQSVGGSYAVGGGLIDPLARFRTSIEERQQCALTQPTWADKWAWTHRWACKPTIRRNCRWATDRFDVSPLNDSIALVNDASDAHSNNRQWVRRISAAMAAKTMCETLFVLSVLLLLSLIFALFKRSCHCGRVVVRRAKTKSQVKKRNTSSRHQSAAAAVTDSSTVLSTT